MGEETLQDFNFISSENSKKRTHNNQTQKMRFFFCVLSMTGLVVLAHPAPQQAGGQRTVKAKFVGDLVETDHGVAGKVYIINENTMAIDKFSYDNDGFGVYTHVATKGRGKKGFVKNKILVPYPSGTQGEPISKKYSGDGQLIIDLKQVGVKASEVKWLSVWCTVFNLSFGHVVV